jgi:hypothetical protein
MGDYNALSGNRDEVYVTSWLSHTSVSTYCSTRLVIFTLVPDRLALCYQYDSQTQVDKYCKSYKFVDVKDIM